MIIWQPRVRTPDQLLWELSNEELKDEGGEDKYVTNSSYSNRKRYSYIR